MNQSQLDSMLKWGIIFSLFWLAGWRTGAGTLGADCDHWGDESVLASAFVHLRFAYKNHMGGKTDDQ